MDAIVMTDTPPCATLPARECHDPEYRLICPYLDSRCQVAWCLLRASKRPYFSPALLDELHQWSKTIEQGTCNQGRGGIRYHVSASQAPGAYHFGCDLRLLTSLIRARNRETLVNYAHSCVNLLYNKINHFGRDITTVSLIQGKALGAGFAEALASDVLIAETSARMGFNENLFNLFPGMGGYLLLAAKIGATRAESLILSGRTYTAAELHRMGVVDLLAEDGAGEAKVYEYIRKEQRSANGYRALRQSKRLVNPITHLELTRVADIWVAAALHLAPSDLRVMECIASENETFLAE